MDLLESLSSALGDNEGEADMEGPMLDGVVVEVAPDEVGEEDGDLYRTAMLHFHPN